MDISALDPTDFLILKELLCDGRRPYREIAIKLNLSNGLVQKRIKKLEDNGFVLGTEIILNNAAFGYTLQVLIGIHLQEAQDFAKVLEELRKIPEVVEAHFTTGNFALIIKVFQENIHDLNIFLMSKLQRIEGIRSTETFLSLSVPIQRKLDLTKLVDEKRARSRSKKLSR